MTSDHLRRLAASVAMEEGPGQDREAAPGQDHERLASTDSPERLSSAQASALFVSHSLSTWNARTYEFAAILFTATAFPDTLAMSSLRGLISTVAALIFSSAIGNAIDSSKTRLGPMLTSIVLNRVSILLACGAWYALFQVKYDSPDAHDGYSIPRLVLFAIAVVLGIVEKLSGIGNMVASERDWVPAIADEQGHYTLTTLNAVMRRIDLVCKLVAPIAISSLISSTSIRIGVLVVGGLSAVSCSFEILNALKVWRTNSRLRQPRQYGGARQEEAELNTIARIKQLSRLQWNNIRYYFSTPVWLPSLALALLYISALSYAATLTTHLLNIGFSLMAVTVARAIGSIVEISSTYVAPLGIHRLARSKRDQENGEATGMHAVGLMRSGLWGLTIQWACLVPVVVSLWQLDAMRKEPPASDPIDRLIRGLSPTLSWTLTSTVLFAFLSLSRMGLWVFDLVVQEMTQSDTDMSKRAAFAGTETALVNLFELSQWILALGFPQVDQFKWLALGSFVAVSCSWLSYALWVRHRRGHLVHLDRFALRYLPNQRREGYEYVGLDSS